MSREIDVSKAKSWTKEEAATNDRYLRDRGRDKEADEAAAARGDADKKDEK